MTTIATSILGRPMHSVSDVRYANRQAGFCYFEPDTMRYFRSRVLGWFVPLPDGGGLFGTSERFVSSQGWSPGRKFTIRRARPSGDIDTVGEFQGYASSKAAERAANRITLAQLAMEAS